MIALYRRWSGEGLPAPLAERLAASLGLGSAAFGVREVQGALLAGPARDKAHARSWTPAPAPHGGLVLLNGHIDNRAELLRALPGAVDPACDNAALYGLCHAAWGNDCDRRIVGEYAAIVWLPASASVVLSRSPIHAPALHVWRDEERLIVSSTARALFATGEVERRIDEQKLADSLYLNYHEAERGWFAGVERVPLGARMVIDRRGAVLDHWYDPANLPQVRLPRDEDYVEAANALLEEGTRAILSGCSRPAVSLSGGLDSQAVAVSALQVLGPEARLLTFTSVPEPGWDGQAPENRFADEREHVAALAAMYPQIDSRLVDAAGLSFDHQLQAIFLLAGAPPRNAMNLHWNHELRRQAKAAGCDLVLSGAMGNCTFSFDGRGSLPTLLRRFRWPALIREARHLARRDRVGLPRALASHALMPLLPDAAWRAVMRWRHGAVPKEELAWCPLNPAWAAEMHVAERAADMGYDALYRARPSTRAYRLAMLQNAAKESGDILPAFDNLWGVPMRDPTAYRPLLEFCFGLPDDQYLRDGQSRWLARRMFAERLPAVVVNERRRGLQSADWHLRLCRQRESLIDEIDRLAQDPAMAHRLDLPRLRAALTDWPDTTPVENSSAMQARRLAVTRGLAAARYVRWVEGRND